VTRRKLRFQDHLLLLVLLAEAPAWLTAVVLLWHWEVDPPFRGILLLFVTAAAVGGALAVRNRAIRPLRALANLLQAIGEGDYTLRGQDADAKDAVGEVMVEANALGHIVREQRLGALEAGTLLNKLMANVDIAVFALDAERHLRLANRAGEALLGASAGELLGRRAEDLGLAPILAGESPHFRPGGGSVINHAFPGGAGRWEVRRRSFREGGKPHELLVISELSRALREEERQTWQRLVRVLGHELNSSLAPIKSMADTLRSLVAREPLPGDWREDAESGLVIIHDRAESLGRFIAAYARLARLPPPARRVVELTALVNRAASLHGQGVQVEAGPDVHLHVDGDQIEQVLINLIKNAVEATGGNGGVRVRWRVANDSLEVEVEDDGPGLANTENLWVPFFTTKRGGTGIGLVLSREIIENHGGTITLENRVRATGCVARIRLPLPLPHGDRSTDGRYEVERSEDHAPGRVADQEFLRRDPD
jgi:nitrogen fixation/metabolism regulation signal transduction histidine kinase